MVTGQGVGGPGRQWVKKPAAALRDQKVLCQESRDMRLSLGVREQLLI